MNFFTKFDSLNEKYRSNPEHARVAQDYINLFAELLEQLKVLSTKSQQKN